MEWALAYRARGWSVLPVRAGDKRPLVRWLEFQTRPPTTDEIEAWYAREPDANVGIVTGVVSGIIVVDVDSRHGGNESLDALERVHGPFPPTLIAITGGGGRHSYFAHPGGEIHNRVGLFPGIDVRGDGGYVVAPPSRHPSGKHYAWTSPAEALHAAPAPPPAWLVDRLRPHGKRPGYPLEHWRNLIERGVAEGQRNSTMASLAGHLLWHGVDLDIVTELLLGWNRLRCRPPLPDDEVVRTVASIGRLRASREATP
jgi:hypothetical protein